MKQFPRDRQQLGFWRALGRLLRRRYAPLIGYLILASATGYNFYVERSHSDSNRQQLAQNITHVLREGCGRNNDLRISLQRILIDNEGQVKARIRRGSLTKADGRATIKFLQQEKARINPLHCKRIYHVK